MGKLKDCRERANLTPAELAKKAQISVMSYYRYENGKRVPDAQTATLIAKAVGSTLEALWSP